MNLETEIFSLSPGVYSRRVMSRLLARYLWIAVLPVLAFAVLGVVCDDAWWWVALIYVFLLLPVFLFFAYFSCTLTRESVEAVKPHKFSLDKGGLKVTLYDLKPGDTEGWQIERGDGFSVYKGDSPGLNTPESSGSYHVPMDELGDLRQEGRWLVLDLRDGKKGFFLIPSTAIRKG